MKISDVSAENVREFLRITEETDGLTVPALLSAATAYIYGYTGLDAEAADLHEDLTVALLVLCSDMYDNRQMVVESDKVNRVVQSILDLYAINLM